MKHYCLGFLYVEGQSPTYQVLLIKKKDDCPLEYVRGKLNGIGGSINEGEPPIDAMIREFREETSIAPDYVNWVEKGNILTDKHNVTIFRGRLKTSEYRFYCDYTFPYQCNEGEVNFYDIEGIHNWNIVENLPILLPLVNTYNNYKFVLDYRQFMGLNEHPLIYIIKE